MSDPGLQVRLAQQPCALLRFDFEAEAGAGAIGAGPGWLQVQVACPPLGGTPGVETWCDASGNLVAWQITVPENTGDVRAAAAQAYRHLLARVRGSTHPHLLRIWNYLDAINAGDGDAERYRRFCQGRAEAVDARFNLPPPAATGIGHAQPRGVVQVVALCARAPGTALENPRQIPAWRYPREYGPVPPGFSRAALYGRGEATRVLLSGTASIVGHRSLHIGDVSAQMRESLDNAAALLHEAERVSGQRFEPDKPDAMRIYLRHPQDLPRVQQIIAAHGIEPDRVACLQADICRRELDVELEAVY